MPPPAPAFAATGAAVANELGVAFGSLFDVFRQLTDVAKSVLDPFRAIRDSLADVTKAATDAVKRALLPFKDTLEDIGAALKIVGTGVSNALGQIGGAIRVFGVSMGNVVTAITAAGQAVMGLGLQLASFVRLASPAMFQQFMNTLDDLTAVLGQAFAPILEAIIPIVRAAADALKVLVPLGQAIGTMLKPFAEIFRSLFNIAAAVLQPVIKVFEVIAPVVASIARVFGELMKAIEPIITVIADLVSSLLESFLKPIVDAINAIMPILIAFARLFGDIMRELANGLREMWGLGPERTPRPGDSTGAAAKSASVGSVSSVLERTMLSAYSLGSAASSPESRTASAAEEIAKTADMIYKAIKDVPAFGEAIKKALGIKTTEITGEYATGVSPFILGSGLLGAMSPGGGRAG